MLACSATNGALTGGVSRYFPLPSHGERACTLSKEWAREKKEKRKEWARERVGAHIHIYCLLAFVRCVILLYAHTSSRALCLRAEGGNVVSEDSVPKRLR